MKTLMALVTGALVLGLVAGAYAQGGTTKDVRMSMAWGKVVSLDKEAKTLTVSVAKRGEEAKETVFAITDETKVLTAGASKPGTLDDVKPGLQVVVMYKPVEGEAKPIALSIRVTPEGAGRAPK